MKQKEQHISVCVKFLILSDMEIRSTSLCKGPLLIIQLILFLPHLASASQTEDINIIQLPQAINISEGESVTMTCLWNITHSESVRVGWLKDDMNIFTKIDKGKYKSDGREYIIEEKYSTLSITNTVQNDSGLYHCEVLVEIPPPVRRASGEGTLLNVFVAQTNNLIFWLLAAISPTMLIVIVVGCCCVRKMKNRRRNGNISNLRRSFRSHAISAELTEKRGKISQTKASSVYENSSIIQKEALKQKIEKRARLYINSAELSVSHQKIEDKSANIYKLRTQQKKHQSMNKVIEENFPSEIYQNT
ncbi:uncharacterized protein LOC119963925 isoform X1 [Scyliorhinus canicula]|uniref:uncharacterized protein LOC119963925 isoform X1 n=1 Tax=Scyliorhinus canicula TaxID=7830 RepID=UPI0018F4704E|nr:uncharacterized protein LOC119963925 isoform X1 [Scyliorhinus canicula]